MLYSQQQGHCDAQNAALMAVQASAEANMRRLTEQQRTGFEEVEANIASNLEAISTHIHQVVEGQLAVLRGEMRPGEDIDHLVQRMVEVSSSGAAESIKWPWNLSWIAHGLRCSVCETNPVDEVIKAVIRDVRHGEMDEKSKLEQETQRSQNPTISGPDRLDSAAQINATIERSIQAAANTIRNVIKIGVRDLNAISDSPRERQQLFDDAEGKDDNADEEKMIVVDDPQCCWERLLGEDVHDDGLEELAVSHPRTCGHEECIGLQQMQFPVEIPATYRLGQKIDVDVDVVSSPANVVLVLQTPLIQELGRPTPVQQEQSWRLDGPANLLPPPISSIQHDEQRRLGHRQPVHHALRHLVDSQQQQLSQRAEVAARRHLAKTKRRTW
ncbi:unnamed protein product [Phytophthora fragariaefolia]|uniref:Unnamed protein product n=1 Tax=Phytophthora fragariaefolia TaxID=1490495 RepID=A0A9W6TUX5_9STRA|nr:unnamed protein product [Phytophthora fragariaefolia]